ncbi:MAG: threonylcarbamoyl-AMP synthase [Ignavibacteria bacterium]|nr:threonylcarbamoyl-AMP synthase [Ignavibacteria bacterium]
MLLRIHPENPEMRKIKMVADCLNDGGVIIYPTDTIYGLGCDIYNQKAIDRLCRIKGINPVKANLSLLCYDFSHLSDFTAPIDTPVFRVMKKALPGPFTFVLRANNNVPKIFKTRKKSVGLRIPDNNIPRMIVQSFGHPIVTTSIHSEDEITEFETDPEIIYEKYQKIVDIVIDGGFGGNKPSTIIDCSDGGFTVLREGPGNIEDFF